MEEKYDKFMEWLSSRRVWDDTTLMEEKSKVMMTLSDAKECRFEPMVGMRAPLEMRAVLKSR